MNQYDSLAIARQLRAMGLRQVAFHQRADAYIVDTCTVTAMADRKSRKTFGRALRKNPNAVFAVTGCAVEWASEQFRAMRPDCLIVGNREKPELPHRLINALRTRETWTECAGDLNPEPRTLNPVRYGNGLCDIRAALKVQDGCNRVCAYCIIPTVRGAPYSRPMREVVREAREFVAEGARELVLTGIILGAYGFEESWRRRHERHPLAELMAELNEIEGLARLRLSTIDPRDIHDDIVEAMASLPKCCPHVHLPLQSGSDAVLKRMKRGYTTAQFAETIETLRAAMPHMGITTDLMVGFPGETDEEFEETMSFARAMRFSGIHVFPFSPRPGTAAANMAGPVSPPLAAERVERLIELSKRLTQEFALRRVGKPAEILVEQLGASNESASGLTPEHLPVLCYSNRSNFVLGHVAEIVPDSWDGDTLTATDTAADLLRPAAELCLTANSSPPI